MKKQKFAAALAAAAVLTMGVSAISFADDPDEIVVNSNTTKELSNETVSHGAWVQGNGTLNAENVVFNGGELAVDNYGTINLEGGSVEIEPGHFSAQGGYVVANNTKITSGLWINAAYPPDEKKVYSGTGTLNNSTVTGTDLAVQGKDAVLTINGGTVDVTNMSAKYSVLADNGDVPEAYGPSTLTLDKGVKATADTVTVEKESTLNMQCTPNIGHSIQYLEVHFL